MTGGWDLFMKIASVLDYHDQKMEILVVYFNEVDFDT